MTGSGSGDLEISPPAYKVKAQRVWPFPNNITQGTSTVTVKGPLTAGAISGPGAHLLQKSVVEDFNAFAGLGAWTDKGEAADVSIEVFIGSADNGIEDVDESYEVHVTTSGIRVAAATFVGAVYGLQTLQQLVRAGSVQGAPMHIVDAPRTGFRAIMLDCARHFLPLPVLLKQVRAMVFHKLNVLHLHLTDGQSFPLSLGPRTSSIALGTHAGNLGAFSAEEVYTASDIDILVRYAAARGVRVVPEVDTPGHSYSWIAGAPGMMTCADVEAQQQAVCPEPPCGFFNLQDQMPQVQAVVSGVLGEVVAAFRVGQPGFGSLLHLGFDEVGCPSRTSSGQCTAPSCVQAYGPLAVQYGNWLLGWARTSLPRGAKVMMWVDQVLTSNFAGGAGVYAPVLRVDPSFVLLHFWSLDATTPGNLATLASMGFQLVNSQANTYYLDAGGEGNGVFWGGPMGNVVSSGSSGSKGESVSVQYQKYWMSTYPGVTGLLTNGWPTSWEDIYTNNLAWLPTTIGAGTASTAGYQFIPVVGPKTASSTALPAGGIVGACCCAWGEQIDATNFDTRLWPKVTAFAEAMWKFDVDRMPDTVEHTRMRLCFTREDLLRLGVRAAPVMSGDVFRAPPWGPVASGPVASGSSGSSGSLGSGLMYDINGPEPARTTGFAFEFKRWWGRTGTCGTPAANPFCGAVVSSTVSCSDPTAAAYVNQGCS
jgi:hexosaminidase